MLKYSEVARMRSSDYPPLRASAASVSRTAQWQYTSLVRIDLVLIIVGAAFGVAASLVPTDAGIASAFASFTLLMVGFFVRLLPRLMRPERVWYDARAVTESVKTASWNYMMRVDPYNQTDNASDTALLNTLGDLLSEHQDLSALIASVSGPQVTDYMRSLRSCGIAERAALYRVERLSDQLNWYQRSRTSHQTWAWIWFGIAQAAQLVALLSAGYRIVNPTAPNVVGVFTSIAAAATAWTQMPRHDELAKSYGVAAHDLSIIGARFDNIPDDDTLARLVTQAENAISREHTSWVAKRS